MIKQMKDDDVERVALEIAGSLMLQMKHSAVHDFHGGDVATVIKLISNRDVSNDDETVERVK